MEVYNGTIQTDHEVDEIIKQICTDRSIFWYLQQYLPMEQKFPI